jgi:hypothetical protein
MPVVETLVLGALLAVAFAPAARMMGFTPRLTYIDEG